MTGVQQMLSSGGGRGVGGFSHGVSDTRSFPTVAVATVGILDNGALSFSGSGLPPPVPPLIWVTPPEPGIGAFYWVRCTVTSGTLASGTVGVWISCSAGPTWGESRSSIGSENCFITLDFALDAAGAALAGSGQVILTATVNP